jgi:hypothetical protein
MNIMKRGFYTGFAVLAFSAASSAYASSPTVVAMHATFITQSNSSGQDPHLDIRIYNDDNKLVAENQSIPGQWTDHAINSVSLDLKSPFTKSDISSGKVALNIHPDGSDDWKFNYNLSITYSDNSVVWERWNGKELSQVKSETSDTITGK